jgi:Fe-S-cluster-containing hydrogenase component 2
MIYVDADLCNGCEACIGVCTTGALSLQQDKAFIDASLCNECEACLDICPQEAILSVEAVEALSSKQVAQTIPTATPVVEIAPQPVTPSLRTLAWPAIGSALLWSGRELLPRLVSKALDLLDRPQPSLQRSSSRQVGGRRQRRRRQRQRRHR